MLEVDTLPAELNLYSPETELAALGCLLNDPKRLNGCDLAPDHFYVERNRIIYATMTDIIRRGDMPDYVTLGTELDKRGKLASIGGPARLMEVINHAGLFLDSYVSILKDLERRRRMMALASRIATIAADKDSDLEQAAPEFIRELVSTAEIKGAAVPFADVLSNLYDDVQSRADNPTDVWGIPTKYPKFDKLTGGLQRGELFILSGEPGVGKSMLAMQMAAQMAETAPGVIYSMEMGGLAVARRLVSGASGIPTRAIKTGQGIDWPAFIAAFERLSSLPIHIADNPKQTILSLRKDISRLVASEGIQWLVLDYLYLLDEGTNEIERTQRASSGLKIICREFDLAGVAIHSMNKAGISSVGAGAEAAPTQDKLRGSGQSIYDADLIAFLTKYNPDLDKTIDKVHLNDRENVRVLWFGKGRELEDPEKFIKFIKRPGYPSFQEYTPEGKK